MLGIIGEHWWEVCIAAALGSLATTAINIRSQAAFYDASSQSYVLVCVNIFDAYGQRSCHQECSSNYT
jgi:hypothetical protein